MAKSGRQLSLSIGSAASALPASKCVAAVEARCPPAEKPQTPIRFGSMPCSFALAPHGADRPLDVEHRAGMQRRRDLRLVDGAVLQNERVHAAGVEPVGDLLALVVGRPGRCSRRRDRRRPRCRSALSAGAGSGQRRDVLRRLSSSGRGSCRPRAGLRSVRLRARRPSGARDIECLRVWAEPCEAVADSNSIGAGYNTGVHDTGAIWFRPGNLRCPWRVVVDQLAT